ncbi:MAG: dTDP-4-dehydrorhamnose 3,5-epimerase [Acidimicrobiia bacterium]
MTDAGQPNRVDGFDEVVAFVSPIHPDSRGNLREIYRADEFRERTGIAPQFVQDNVSVSHRGVLRGIHIQVSPPQGKLVSCLAGEVFDVVVDLRGSSSTYRKWKATTLSHTNGIQVWVPPGFGHAFLVVSESALVHYKATTPYHRDGTRSVRWDDPAIGIQWPTTDEPHLSQQDGDAPLLAECDLSPR